ncbi:MAG: cell division protein FtsZ [Clostridia bacterium]|nr:cell division protein FtsZ [Clostridia bacterium]
MFINNEDLNVCKIKVIGVGGAGCNAVNRMIDANITSAEFAAVNTDKQALMISKVSPENKVVIGETLTQGLGAGSDPEVGEKAAEESKNELEELVDGVNLLFIAAGMGGGTGTGAAPILARIAKTKGCVTVAVVTKPFSFEGRKRAANAEEGIANLKKYVDTIVIIPNDKLLDVLPEDVTMLEALKHADESLRQGICGITDLISTPALINLDFADVKTIITNQGLAHMGVGHGYGDNKVLSAVKEAVSSPLLETDIEGAQGVILNITGGPSLSLRQVREAAELVRGVIDEGANFIFGANISEELGDDVEITVIATGFTPNGKSEKLIDKLDFNSHTETETQSEENVGSAAEEEVSEEEKNRQLYEFLRAEAEKDNAAKEEERTEEVKPKKELPPFMKKLFGKK